MFQLYWCTLEPRIIIGTWETWACLVQGISEKNLTLVSVVPWEFQMQCLILKFYTSAHQKATLNSLNSSIQNAVGLSFGIPCGDQHLENSKFPRQDIPKSLQQKRPTIVDSSSWIDTLQAPMSTSCPRSIPGYATLPIYVGSASRCLGFLFPLVWALLGPDLLGWDTTINK